MGEVVTIRREGPVLEIVLDRPPANAIDLATSRAMFAAFEVLKADDALRVGILMAGENEKGIFSAGWDLKAIAQGDGRSQDEGFDLGPGGLGGLPEFWDLYKPVIAAVDGAAVGGGFELAMAADIVCAAEEAYFSLPEMQRGFLPDAGAIQRLHHLVPYNVARDLILTGRRMTAAEAKHWGFVRDVVPKSKLKDHVRALAAEISTGAPHVPLAYKEYLRKAAHLPFEEAHRTVRAAWRGEGDLEHYKAMLASDDFDEGAIAFAEKRKPKFDG